MRLIDADALKPDYYDEFTTDDDEYVVRYYSEHQIDSMPTIEPKQGGEWIDEAGKYDASFGMHDYRCSNCNSYADEHIYGHEWYTALKPNFCPNCGAKMK